MNYVETKEYIADPNISKDERLNRLEILKNRTNDPIATTIVADYLYNNGNTNKSNILLAEECYKKAIQLAEKNNQSEIMDIANSHLGNMYYKQKNYEQALEYLQSSPSVDDILKCAEISKHDNNSNSVYSYYNVAEKNHCYDAILMAYEYARAEKDFDRMREYSSKYIKLDSSIASDKTKQQLANEVKAFFYKKLRDSKNTNNDEITIIKKQEEDFDQLLRN